ncbi:degenerin mec-10-like isoform X1 [Biomphalaria glabrata]|uniref:Degenerin mec-10-like isoform X1 n=2 Tax=Biomphalaria glabrata TaxID=6526 RepID=A0A9W3AGL9_BIOGL|nr:degenerin mec-10-like isoform X1 [Biomphalaria glabrata]
MKVIKVKQVTPVEVINNQIDDVKCEETKPSFGEIFSDYARVASMNGVPLIEAASSPTLKAIWSFLLAAAIGAMVFHLYTLFDRYLRYDKHAEIDMSFSSLQFPAVTVCNTNIMRSSMTRNASNEIHSLLADIKNKSQQIVEANSYNELNFDETVSTDYWSDSCWNYYYYYYNETDWYDLYCDCVMSQYSNTGSTYQEEKKSEIDINLLGRAENDFQTLFSFMDSDIKKLVGHQLEDMLLQCTFGRIPCLRFKNFTQTVTANYGNCYTVDEKFIAKRSGPDGGLELILFLELGEYLQGITSGRGAQVVIHEKGSYPFPEDEGISIPAGQQTVISLRQLKINRLSEPYDRCTNRDIEKYTYTRNLCQKKCIQGIIIKSCNCYDTRFESMSSMTNITSGYLPCTNSTNDQYCIQNVTNGFEDNERDCQCFNPCNESIYEKSVSYKQWPNDVMAKYLANQVCKNNSTLCDSLWNLSNSNPEELRMNFLKLNIFFQDLNFEERSDQANYEFTTLLSDIGGSIGLWIGLSILSLFEIVDLLLRLVYKVLTWTRKCDVTQK